MKWNRVIAALGMVVLVACEKSDQAPASATIPAERATAPQTSTPAAPQTIAPAVQPSAPLSLVTDRSLVCMVNNQFMGRPQIPIVVSGNTYYGCCEMCKGRLAKDPASRTAVDPVSRRAVDKAVAVIGKAENGSTVYFEPRENFEAYSRL